MNVSAIIVTRGDVSLTRILDSFPSEWERVVWDNGRGRCWSFGAGLDYDPDDWAPTASPDSIVDDKAVYGRYAAIEHASHDLIYVQDDDVLHKPEGIEAIVAAWFEVEGTKGEHVVCNMPANFRHSFYAEHALVGFGAVFQRDTPFKAFERFAAAHNSTPVDLLERVGINDSLRRTCDIVFTALTPRVLVDVPYADMPWASAPNRMWQQKTHREERGRMLDLVLQVRDAT